MNISEKINKLVSQKEAQMSLGKFAFISLGKSNMKATVKLYDRLDPTPLMNPKYQGNPFISFTKCD